MKGTKDNININNDVKNQILRAEISEAQRSQAKKLAKSKRMTFSGWLGLLIETELKSESNKQLGENS